jgi:hypothetical protein
MEPYNNSYPTANNRCPKCRNKLDKAFCTTGDFKPRAGDFTLCAKCGVLLVFDDKLTLRFPTTEEDQKAGMHPQIIEAQLVIRGMKR